MSSSSSRILIFLMLGLVIGGSVGYFSNKIVTNPQIFELQAQLTDAQITLSNTIIGYESDLEDLQDELDDLESEYNILQSQHNQLNEDYSELSDSYDDLLTNYEQMLGAIPLTPEPPSTEVIEKEFTWWYDSRKWEMTLSVPESIYEYYSSQNRPPTEDYSIYVTHPFDDEYIRILIEKINFIAISRDYTEAEKVDLVIAFVQSLPYTSDSVTTPYDEYPRFPLETLVDDGGDCEDTSILTAALLYGMNYDVVLLGLPGHMACGVYTQGVYGTYYLYDGREYYFLETTNEGWQIGEMPDDYKQESAHIYKLKSIPIMTHTWTASQKNDVLYLTVTVSNEGTSLAQGYKVYAAFDQEDSDYVWNPAESVIFDLQFGRDITFELDLDIPYNKHTRLIVGVLDNNGYLIDVSYSQWYDT